MFPQTLLFQVPKSEALIYARSNRELPCKMWPATVPHGFSTPPKVGVGHEKILKPCETTVLDTAKVMFQQDFKAIMFPVLRGTSGYPCYPQCDLKRPTSTKQPPPLTTSLSGSSSNFSLMNLRFFAWTMATKSIHQTSKRLEKISTHGPPW